jgi:hypothetical protein
MNRGLSSSTPTDLGGLRRLMASKISDSERGAKDKISEDGERVQR